MTKLSIQSEIRTSYVQVPNDDLLIDAYLAEPTTPGTFPGVLVIQEIFGVNIHIRDVAERLAQAGYVAIAPALYQRTAPKFDVGYTPEDVQIGRKFKELTTADEILSDLRASIAYLTALPTVKSDAIGSIGFCFGGHVVYLAAATLPEIKATALFYGAGIPTSIPGGGEPTITRTPSIKGTIYGFFGEEDQGIPPEQVDQVEAALTQYQIDHQIFRYPAAGHGFFCDKRASYNPDAAADAWSQVLDLFQHKLV
jgi:carboxymethylenebutenolidase